MTEPQNIDKAIVRRFREIMADRIGVDKKYRFMKAFADKNQMHPQNIVSILNHRQMLSVATLKRLSQNESVSLNWLLLGVGEKYFEKAAKKKPTTKAPAKKASKK